MLKDGTRYYLIATVQSWLYKSITMASLWSLVKPGWYTWATQKSQCKLKTQASHVEFGNDCHWPSKNGFLLLEWIYYAACSEEMGVTDHWTSVKTLQTLAGASIVNSIIATARQCNLDKDWLPLLDDLHISPLVGWWTMPLPPDEIPNHSSFFQDIDNLPSEEVRKRKTNVQNCSEVCCFCWKQPGDGNMFRKYTVIWCNMYIYIYICKNMN